MAEQKRGRGRPKKNKEDVKTKIAEQQVTELLDEDIVNMIDEKSDSSDKKTSEEKKGAGLDWMKKQYDTIAKKNAELELENSKLKEDYQKMLTQLQKGQQNKPAEPISDSELEMKIRTLFKFFWDYHTGKKKNMRGENIKFDLYPFHNQVNTGIIDLFLKNFPFLIKK